MPLQRRPPDDATLRWREARSTASADRRSRPIEQAEQHGAGGYHTAKVAPVGSPYTGCVFAICALVIFTSPETQEGLRPALAGTPLTCDTRCLAVVE